MAGAEVRWAAAVACALAALASAQPSVARGRVFEVRCDFHDPRSAQQALAAAEAVWPRAVRALGVRDARRAEPLVLHLYATEAAYLAAEAARTDGAFARNGAFSFRGDLTAHVHCAPFWSAATRARLGVPAQVQRLVTHEAAHLALYALCRGRAAFQPAWFAEGWTQSMEVEVLADLGEPAAPEQHPWFAQDMVRAQQLRARAALPAVAGVLAGDLDGLAFHDRYAVFQELWGMLAARHPRAVRSLLRALPTMASTPELPQRMVAHLRAAVGARAWSRIDVDFAGHVEGLRPAWREAVRSLAPWRDGLVQAAFPDTNAVAFRAAPVGAAAYRVDVRLELLEARRDGEDAPPQLSLLLDESNAGFVAVAFHGGGRVVLFEYRRAGDTWRRLAAVECAAVVPGREVAARVQVGDGRIAVAVGGEQVLDIAAPARAWSGPWGLGALRGSVGLWHAVEVNLDG